jgi:hypothetical protein
MPSFKLWFLSALALFAIVFPRSTVFAEEVPAEKAIVGSWRVTLVVDPKKAEPQIVRYYQDRVRIRIDMRQDGTFAASFYFDGKPIKDGKIGKGTWALLKKEGKKFVLEFTPEGKEEKNAYSFSWISKDEFTLEVPPDTALAALFITALHIHRKKDAPKP